MHTAKVVDSAILREAPVSHCVAPRGEWRKLGRADWDKMSRRRLGDDKPEAQKEQKCGGARGAGGGGRCVVLYVGQH